MESAIEKITVKIERLKSVVDEIKDYSQGIPALDCNLKRIEASVKMLELNFVDIDPEGS